MVFCKYQQSFVPLTFNPIENKLAGHGRVVQEQQSPPIFSDLRQVHLCLALSSSQGECRPLPFFFFFPSTFQKRFEARTFRVWWGFQHLHSHVVACLDTRTNPKPYSKETRCYIQSPPQALGPGLFGSKYIPTALCNLVVAFSILLFTLRKQGRGSASVPVKFYGYHWL